MYYTPGYSLSAKDVTGGKCPAVIIDGDSVLCLFPGSNGMQQARDLCYLLNSLDNNPIPASLK